MCEREGGEGKILIAKSVWETECERKNKRELSPFSGPPRPMDPINHRCPKGPLINTQSPENRS